MTMKEVAINAKRPRSQFVAVAQKNVGSRFAVGECLAQWRGCCVRGKAARCWFRPLPRRFVDRGRAGDPAFLAAEPFAEIDDLEVFA